MEQKKRVSNKEMNDNWDALLKMFHSVIEKNPSDYKEQLDSIKEMAKIKPMTPRQVEGITDRCDYAIKGEYGNTKTMENLSIS